jgi:hypothetical protein
VQRRRLPGRRGSLARNGEARSSFREQKDARNLALIALSVGKGYAASELSSPCRCQQGSSAFLKKSAQKTSSALQRRSGGEDRVSNPEGAKRRPEVFLLLFVHKKKTLLASLPRAPARSAASAKASLAAKHQCQYN